MRRFVSVIFLVVCAFTAGIALAYAEARRVDAYFLSEKELPEIEALEIAPSDAPWVLFEAFGKRFTVATAAEVLETPRSIRGIAAAGRGDRAALTFLLLNLFRLNGIDAQLVFLSAEGDIEHDDRPIEQVLVYVPALRQYFDPALPFDKQHDSTDRAWLSGRGRMYFSAALQHNGKAVGRCRDLCLSVAGSRYRGGEFRVPNAMSVKTIRVPVTHEGEGRSPKQ